MGFYEPPDSRILFHGARREKPAVSWNDFKPTVIPDGFILLVDTREQSPLFTGWPIKKGEIRTHGDLIIKGVTLRVGDYSVSGYEKQVAIERKKQSDFESFIQKEYQTKTIKKLQKMSKMFFAGLVIEADEADLFEYPISPKMTREKVRAHLASMNVHYRVHVKISNNRKKLELWCLDRLTRAYRYLHDGILFKSETSE